MGRGLTIASALAWFWGLFFGMSGVALGMRAIARNGVSSGQAAFHLLLTMLAVALCYAGFGLRRCERSAGSIAIVVGVVLVAMPLFVPAPLMWVDAAVNLAIIVLTIANWRELRAS